MRDLAERLGEMEVDERVRVTLADGTAFEGKTGPIDYVPEESLRMEVRPEDETTDRYEIKCDCADGWGDLRVRHVDTEDPDADWERLSNVEEVEVLGDETGPDGAESA